MTIFNAEYKDYHLLNDGQYVRISTPVTNHTAIGVVIKDIYGGAAIKLKNDLIILKYNFSSADLLTSLRIPNLEIEILDIDEMQYRLLME